MDEAVPDLIEPPSIGFEGRPAKKVPITIITGFLGSGKTTLLQHILLGTQHDLKVAVLMNEFGETGMMERQMMLQKSGYLGEEWVEFDNGCLCCSAKDAAMIVIESLLKKRRDIDHIVIETSGMADPGIDMKQLAAIIDGNYLGAIVQKLWAEEALECRAQLDGVICLVDSLYGEQRLDPASPDYSIEAARQAALADLVILNKIDLVEEAARDGLRQRFKSINPLSIITETTFSRVSLKDVLNLGEYRDIEQRKKASLAIGMLAHLHLSSSRFGEAAASNALRSFSVVLPGRVDLPQFEKWLFTLLWERKLPTSLDMGSCEIMRVKGIISAGSGAYALQVVQEMYDLFPLDRADFAEGRPYSRLVFIGKFTAAHEGAVKDTFLGLSRAR